MLNSKNTEVFMVIKFTLVYVLIPVVVSAMPIDVPIGISTNLPPYVRDRGKGTGCASVRHPLSRSGMNTFSPKPLSIGKALEAYYSAIAYLRYDFQRVVSCEHPKLNMKSLFQTKTSFDTIPDSDFKIAGVRLSEMNVVASAFEVKNRMATNELSCVMLSFRKGEQYMFTVYYVENTGASSISFIEASCNYDLLGEESDCPFLSEAEYRQHRKILEEYNSHRFRDILPKTVPPDTTTNDVEVFVSDL